MKPVEWSDGKLLILDQTLLYPSGKYVVGPAVFRCVPGIGLEGQVDARALEVLLECDGRRTLGDLVNETALRQGASAESVAALAEDAVRHLVERGFMVPRINHTQGECAC